MAEIVCSRCGHPNSPASNFCSSCGYDLARADSEPTETHLLDLASSEDTIEVGAASADTEGLDVLSTGEVPALAGEISVFVVKRGAKAGSRFLLDNAVITIGRHPDSAIFLDDVTVSRRHAEVLVDGAEHVVADVGSLNGTYLNRERIDRARLTSGDEVQIGKFKLVFLAGQGS